jgi:hypothetical protein
MIPPQSSNAVVLRLRNALILNDKEAKRNRFTVTRREIDWFWRDVVAFSHKTVAHPFA